TQRVDELVNENVVQVTDDDGREVWFTPDGNGGYERPDEFAADLAADGNGGWTLTWVDGTVWSFGADGWLASVTDWTGQTLTITRDLDGRATRVDASTGAWLELTYSGTPSRLTNVEMSDGRSIDYAYDANGDLTSSTALGIATT